MDKLKPCQMLEDEREIEQIFYEDGSDVNVGDSGVTAIKAYGEHGLYCNLPWLAIYKGDEIARRIPANFVEIHYK